ncbi:MAG: T9SS type A sorting domain-containing protein [Ignavibacteria bacterium]
MKVNKGILILTFSTIFLLKPLESQWVNMPTGIVFTIFSMSAIDDNIIWACSSGPNVIRTTDGGNTWINLGTNIPVNGVETCIYAFDVNSAIFSCYTGNPTNAFCYKTTNAGANWIQVFTQAPGFITAFAFKNQTQGFMLGWPVGGRWSLWKTSNAGNNWDSTGLFIPESNPNYWSFENAIIYNGSNLWFGARGRGVYYSTNDGNNWTLSDLTSGGFPYPSALYFETPQTGYTSAQLNLVKSTNGGVNWTVLPGTTSPENVTRGVFSQNNEIWFVRDLDPNIYYSSNSGANWITQYTNQSGTGYKYLTRARNGSTLWACTIAGEVQKYVLPPNGISNQSNNVPSGYKLFQNYPNPFNPVTKIRFEIPSDVKREMSNVKIIVYDLPGHEVATLVNENLHPGIYNATWNGSNYSSGLYFYRLVVDGKNIATKKMILVK